LVRFQCVVCLNLKNYRFEFLRNSTININYFCDKIFINRPADGCLQSWSTLTGRITTFNFLSTTSSSHLASQEWVEKNIFRKTIFINLYFLNRSWEVFLEIQLNFLFVKTITRPKMVIKIEMSNKVEWFFIIHVLVPFLSFIAYYHSFRILGLNYTKDNLIWREN
jgi:hypothetical protein